MNTRTPITAEDLASALARHLLVYAPVSYRMSGTPLFVNRCAKFVAPRWTEGDLMAALAGFRDQMLREAPASPSPVDSAFCQVALTPLIDACYFLHAQAGGE